jgi:acetylornithine deacetylase/succinyl-diaminopimelate desuccinylase-like protein
VIGDESLVGRVRALAFPRFAGTDGERRAADLVAERLSACGLAVSREPIRVGRRAIRVYQRTLFGAGAALVALAGLGAARDPRLGVLGALALAALLARSARWTPRIERLFDAPPWIESQNVVARRPAPQASVSIVLLAHLDSKSSRLPTFFTVASLLVALGVTAALGAWSLLALVSAAPAPDPRAVLPAAAAASAALLAVALLQRSGDASPGAMDNASGLAVLLECARALPDDPALAAADLTFVATGAEEIGLAGAMRWIQAHAGEHDPARTLFVNVDSVGVGSSLLASDVAGRAPSGEPTRALVARAARRAGSRVRLLPILLGAGVDTMPIRARGFATVTILGEVLGAPSRRMHSAHDTVEHLSEPALQDAAAFAISLAREAASSGPLPAPAAGPP